MAEATIGGFSAEEREAMKERAKEMRVEAKRGKARFDGLADLLAKIAEMPSGDRAIAEKVHEIVTATAPQLAPKTWYGQPAYAHEDGRVVVFFQASDKFKVRYSTLGFNEAASLDDGSMWPTAFAILEITPADEKQIAQLVKRAAG